MRWTLAVPILAALALPVGALAQSHRDHHATVQPDDLKWSAPAAYAKGAQLAVVKGDPTKEGFYVVRLKVPAGYRIAAHTHPNDENVTVLSGSFNIGTGEVLDTARARRSGPGGTPTSRRA
jgi:quercetin dioxygenase-like cupin family protein